MSRGYLERWVLLDEELEPALVLPVAIGAKAKRVLHDRLRATAEGFVFKQRAAPYKAGRGTTQKPTLAQLERQLKNVVLKHDTTDRFR